VLRHLVEISLRHRGIVIAQACVALVYGVTTTDRAKLDVFPEFAPPQVVIQTEAPGLPPEQVEQLVTRPIETTVNGVGNLFSIRSQSIQGLSIVTVVFRDDTDIYRARQMVSERLVEANSQLPQGVHPPTMAPLTSATSMILDVGLTSHQRNLMELRTFADWTLRPRLLAVPGVANVTIFGGEVRQLQIQVQPERLLAYDLSIDEVLTAARAATGEGRPAGVRLIWSSWLRWKSNAIGQARGDACLAFPHSSSNSIVSSFVLALTMEKSPLATDRETAKSLSAAGWRPRESATLAYSNDADLSHCAS